MKTFGANIRCSCGAQPYPDNPTTTRESFDLVKIGNEWYCERCRPAEQKRAPRIVAATPLAAVAEFERTFAIATARLEATLANRDIDIEAYCRELAPAFAALKKAIGPREPPSPPDTPKPARLKPVGKGRRSGSQGELGELLSEKEPAVAEPAGEP